MMKRITLLILIAPLSINAMEKSTQKIKELHAIKLGFKQGSPCGLGCEGYEKNAIINSPSTRIETLGTWKFDFSQGNCLQDFNEKFKKQFSLQDKELLLTGIAGGAGTLINWLSQQPQEGQKQVKALVVESTFVDSDFAVDYAEKRCKPVAYLPFARVWLQFATNAYHPTYNPFGVQPIKSASNLPKDLPIIIMHATQNTMAPINGSRRLYCTLQHSGNENVYLFETDAKAHADIWDNDSEKSEKMAALQQIYKKHQLPHNESILSQQPEVDIQKFQPSIEEVKKRIETTNGWRRFIRNTIDVSTVGSLIGLYLYWLI